MIENLSYKKLKWQFFSPFPSLCLPIARMSAPTLKMIPDLTQLAVLTVELNFSLSKGVHF